MFRRALLVLLVLGLWVPHGPAVAADTCGYSTAEQIALTTAVTRLKEKGLMMVTPPRVYAPDRGLSRAQAAFGLFRALGLTESPGPAFADTAGHWAERYLTALKNRGIIRGFPSGDFGPEEPVTLPHYKLMLARALVPESGAYDPDRVLRAAGVDPDVPCGGTGPINLVQYILLLDRFVRAPALAEIERQIPDMDACPYLAAYAFAKISGAMPGDLVPRVHQLAPPGMVTAFGDGDSVYVEIGLRLEEDGRPLSVRHEARAREAVALLRHLLEQLGAAADIGVAISWGCFVD